MSSYYIESIDPQELAEQFSTEDGQIEPIEGMDGQWKEEKLAEIRSILDQLPDREADLVRLYYFRDKIQDNLADMFGVSQAAISYRIQRARERLRFILDLPDLSDRTIRSTILSFNQFDQTDADIFVEMYRTSCQSEVANRLDITQGQVRHRFMRNLQRISGIILEETWEWVDTHDHAFDALTDRMYELECEHGSMERELFEEEMFDWMQDLRAIDAESDPEGYHDVELTDQLRNLLDIYEAFVKIRHNFNMLHEVKLPECKRRDDNFIT